MAINTKIQNLHERFLNLARNMLGDDIIAKAIADDAFYKVQKEYKQLAPEQNLILWSMGILDEKINDQLLLEDAKRGSKKAENSYFTKLRARLLATAYSANKSKPQDIEDIVQETLQRAFNRYKTLKYPLIPWALMELKSIAGKYFYKKIKISTIEQPEQENIDQETGSNPDPLEMVHYKLLKERLLQKAIKLANKDKQIFEIIFSGGGRKEMIEQFPDLNTNTIDTRLRRFRKGIKKELENMGMATDEI